MKILVKENCFAAGKALSTGDIVDLPDDHANVLRTMGYATAEKEAVAAAEAAGKKSKKGE